jgi:hypothetical protein
MSGKTVFGSATDPTAEPGSPKLEDKNNPITSPGRKIYDGQQAGAKAGDFGWAGPDPVQPVTPPPVNADAVAMAKLKGKNRKRRHHSFVVPMNLTIESATVFTLSGFAAGFDGPWLLMHTENRMMGKAGDTTTLDMQKCLDF